MGSRGAFLESGGFSAPAQWHTIDYVDGIKVLAHKDSKKSINLPERSNTPGTAYISFRKNGVFNKLRVFDDKRMPKLDIDYGIHRGGKSLHVHYYVNGRRGEGNAVTILNSGELLYAKYKKLFKGVKL